LDRYIRDVTRALTPFFQRSIAVMKTERLILVTHIETGMPLTAVMWITKIRVK
jgi:hypothetical protein